MIPGDGGIIRIRIDFDVDDASLLATRAKIAALSGESDNLTGFLDKLSDSFGDADKSGKGLGDSLDKIDSKTGRLTKNTDRLDKSIKKSTKSFGRSRLKMMALLVSIVLVAAEWWLMVAALASVNGLLAVGQAIMESYRFVMKGVAYSLGAVTVALGVALAAQREYNASMQAFRYTAFPALSSGTSQASAALRMLTSDSSLAVFGMQALTATFTEVSKSTNLTGDIQKSLRGLSDFAVSGGGDIGQNLAALGGFLGQLKKSGSVTDDVAKAAGEVSAEFGQAVENAKNLGIVGADELLKLFSSGEFAKISGIQGATEAINQTLFGQLKSYFTEIQVMFGDFGQFFLADAKIAMAEFVSEFRISFTRLSGIISQELGGGKLFDDVVEVLTKFMDFSINVMEKYLPQTDNMWSWLRTTVEWTIGFFDRMGKSMKGLSEAAKVMTDSFGPVFGTFFGGIKEAFKDLADYAVDNRDEFIAFGDAASNIFDALRTGIELVKDAWLAALPFLTGVLNVLAVGIEAVAGPISGMLRFFKQGGEGGSPDSVMGQSAAQSGASPSSGGGFGPFSGLGDMGGMVGGLALIGGMAALKNRLDTFRGKGLQDQSMFSRAGGRLNTFGSSRLQMFRERNMHGPAMAGGDRPPPPRPGGRLGLAKRMMPGGGGGGAAAIGGQIAMLGLGAQDGSAAPFQAVGGAVSLIPGAQMAGLAISGAGTALTADNTFKGAAAGAMGGAALGLLIGGPVGAAIGAGIGTVAGAFSGAIRQYDIGLSDNDAKWKDVVAIGMMPITLWVENQRKNQTKDVARERVFEDARDVMTTAMTGGVERARRRVNEVSREVDKFSRFENEFSGKSMKERQKMADDLLAAGEITSEIAEGLSARHMSEYGDELRLQGAALEEAADVGLTEFGRKLEGLTTISGKSESEIKSLADSMGVNLMDGTQSMIEALGSLGLATMKTAGEIKASTREAYASGIETLFRAPAKAAEAASALDEMAEGMRALGPEGMDSMTLDNFFADMADAAFVAFEGDPLGAAVWMNNTFGPNGTAYQSVTGPLSGFGGVTAESGDQGDVQKLALQAMGQQSQQEVSNFTTALLTGSGIAGSQNQSNKLIEALTGLRLTAMNDPVAALKLENLETLMTSVVNKTGITDDDGNIVEGEAAANLLESKVAAIMAPPIAGLEQLQVDFAAQATSDEIAALAAGEISEAATRIIEEFGTAIREVMEDSPEWYKNHPKWYDNPPEGLMTAISSGLASMRPPQVTVVDGDGKVTTTTDGDGDDTTSSRLASTMGRHGMFDSMLSGKRTITSSWRNWGLGSLNSDHVTGNAYDLQGQNLVGYSALVNRMGGFAEFHGSGAERHLHVVPGSVPLGDAMAPVASPVIAVGASGGNNYSIQIYPQPGQDANAIANAVVARIDQRDRNKKERS